jgi:CelD/BcsL family acetyltransferase involved in cellulose biosynthesis
MEAFFKLHLKRWTAKGKPGNFGSEIFRRFHLNLAEVFDEKGWLSLHFLMVNDDPVAAAYTFNYNLKKYGYSTGFDPAYSRFGVGNLLKMHIISECIKKGYREYDLARDFEPYKANWTTHARKNYVATMVRDSVFAEIYNHFANSRISSLLYNKFGLQLSLQSTQ